MMVAEHPAPAATGTILVVDDDEAVRKALVRVLKRAGYMTLEARDGSEAIHMFAERFGQISAVTLDLEMPTTNGREALAMLSEYDPNLPIVIATAYAPDHLIGRQPGSKGVGFVQKPFTADELTREIRRVMAEVPPRGA